MWASRMSSNTDTTSPPLSPSLLKSHIWNKDPQIHTFPDVTDEVCGCFFLLIWCAFQTENFTMPMLICNGDSAFFHYSLLWKQNRLSSEWQVCFPVKIPTNSQPVMFCSFRQFDLVVVECRAFIPLSPSYALLGPQCLLLLFIRI